MFAGYRNPEIALALLERGLAFCLVFLILSGPAFTADSGKPIKLSEQNRRELIRAFTAESAFTLRTFPMGKAGLKIENGQVSPSEAEVRQLTADNGPACRPGERVQITNLRFAGRDIVFEINGGPLARKKWWQRVQAGSVGGVAPAGSGGSEPDDVYNHAHGSNLTLAFKDYVPELTAAQVKELLAPVLDFKAESAAEAYEKSLPPKLQQAVKEHRALVGMDREMVTYAKGRPPRRIRERDGATEYEEWIYGQPPAEVEFVRFVDETVIRVETMKVDGEKIVSTEPDADLAKEISSMAGKTSAPLAADTSAPSLLRPGETPPQSKREGSNSRTAPAASPMPGGPNSTGIPDAGWPTPARMPASGGADQTADWQH
jgi:hypothetical protein